MTVGRVLRRVGKCRKSMGLCGNNMPRRSAASRSGNSAIDGFSLFQDRAAADEIPARLDRLALDEIDRAPKKAFQRVLKIGECRKIVAGGRFEGDEEIGIALIRIETRVTRSRAEDLQPCHAIAAAE